LVHLKGVFFDCDKLTENAFIFKKWQPSKVKNILSKCFFEIDLISFFCSLKITIEKRGAKKSIWSRDLKLKYFQGPKSKKISVRAVFLLKYDKKPVIKGGFAHFEHHGGPHQTMFTGQIKSAICQFNTPGLD
jgi:hypothetical protein